MKKNKKAVRFGSQGGNAILKQRGKKYFSLLAKKRWAKVKKAKKTK